MEICSLGGTPAEIDFFQQNVILIKKNQRLYYFCVKYVVIVLFINKHRHVTVYSKTNGRHYFDLSKAREMALNTILYY